MPVTDNPQHPDLGHGVDEKPRPQNNTYLVLNEGGYVRPLRYAYQHVGRPAPQYSLYDLTPEQREVMGGEYVKFEPYPLELLPRTGRFWTQAELDGGCGATTILIPKIAETYARNPQFYGSTYCMGCHMHRPLIEFIWTADGERVGS